MFSISKRYPVPFTLALLALVALACQAVTPIPAEPTETATTNETAVTINEDEIIASAVATVSAQQPVPVSDTVVVDNSGLPIGPDLETQFIDLYNRLNPSVVHIFIFDADNIGIGSGSGFVYDETGNIVTNNHVITGADSIEVVFANGERRVGSVVGTDIDSDLAVINVNSLPAGASPLPLGDSSSIQVGELVVAIGNPFGESGSMTIGIVSGLGRTLDSQRTVLGGRFSIPQVIQTDAAINPGNSGGPLLNLNGEVIGVNSAINSLTGVNSGVGFSIPVNAVRKIAPSLVEQGEHDYSFIGITMTSEPFTLAQLEAFNLPPNGIYVTTVQGGSPGDEAGLIGSNTDAQNAPLQSGGDYIRAVDGVQLRTSAELLSYLVFETNPGDTVQLTVLRDGEEIMLPLTLGERP